MVCVCVCVCVCVTVPASVPRSLHPLAINPFSCQHEHNAKNIFHKKGECPPGDIILKKGEGRTAKPTFWDLAF